MMNFETLFRVWDVRPPRTAVAIDALAVGQAFQPAPPAARDGRVELNRAQPALQAPGGSMTRREQGGMINK